MNQRKQILKNRLLQQVPVVTAFVYWLLFVQAWWQNKNILLIIGCFAGYVVFSVLTGKKRSNSGVRRNRGAGSVRRGSSTNNYDELEEEHRIEMDRQLEMERQREHDRELERQREYDRERDRERQREYDRRQYNDN